MKEIGIGLTAFAIGITLIIGVIFGSMYGWAHFRLWKAEYSGKALEIEKQYKGKAILAEAENSRKAAVETAKAELDSAQLRADAIKIVGKAAKEFPEYRQQEFIGAFAEALKEGSISQIMYVPTEANIPITEAGRFTR